MTNAKKDAQEKGGRANASAKLSKEMKADIENLMNVRDCSYRMAIFPGVLAALTVGLLLSLLGMSIGLSLFSPTKGNKANKDKQNSSTKTKKQVAEAKKNQINATKTLNSLLVTPLVIF